MSQKLVYDSIFLWETNFSRTKVWLKSITRAENADKNKNNQEEKR